MAKSKILYKQFARYLVVGGSNVILDFLILYLLVQYVHLWYMLAATISFIIVLTYSFILNKNWAFKESSESKRRGQQFLLFAIINIVGVGISLIILYSLVQYAGLWYLYAKVWATAIAVIWNFTGFRLWVFKTRE
jgi:putative flippase GtrA